MLPFCILRLGGVPSCRFWRDLETRTEVEVVSASRSGHAGLARPTQVVELTSLRPLTQSLLSEHGFPASAVPRLCEEFPLSECAHLRALSQVIPAESALFLGNSLSIRQWNLAAVIGPAEAHCHVMRGANGIDGNLSFFLGVAASYPESWAIVGDLTALYDLAAPWILQQMPPGRRRIVIMNNGGGLIFRRLPALREMSATERPVIENPHALRFKSWADQWGLSYRRIHTANDWQETFPDDDLVIEILPEAAQSEAFWQALAQA